MRILIVGAGAIGGYFGGRLLEAGRDVTFLVRPGRAAQLATTGLVIVSSFGNASLPSPPTILAADVREPFDLVILSCKAYDLDTAIDAFARAVGADTSVIPLLNGIRHLDILDARLGATHVLGGQCLISVRRDDAGRIVHLNDLHLLSFGARAAEQAERIETIAAALRGARFETRASDDIVLEMWEKWVFLAALAGITCLMRAAVGDIAAVGGGDLATALLDECRSIATAAGWAPRPAFLAMARDRLTDPRSTVTASMLRDVEGGGPTEAEHILGDLLRRRADVPASDRSLLRIAFTGISATATRGIRERSAQNAADSPLPLLRR